MIISKETQALAVALNVSFPKIYETFLSILVGTGVNERTSVVYRVGDDSTLTLAGVYDSGVYNVDLPITINTQQQLKELVVFIANNSEYQCSDYPVDVVLDELRLLGKGL